MELWVEMTVVIDEIAIETCSQSGVEAYIFPVEILKPDGRQNRDLYVAAFGEQFACACLRDIAEISGIIYLTSEMQPMRDSIEILSGESQGDEGFVGDICLLVVGKPIGIIR